MDLVTAPTPRAPGRSGLRPDSLDPRSWTHRQDVWKQEAMAVHAAAAPESPGPWENPMYHRILEEVGDASPSPGPCTTPLQFWDPAHASGWDDPSVAARKRKSCAMGLEPAVPPPTGAPRSASRAQRRARECPVVDVAAALGRLGPEQQLFYLFRMLDAVVALRGDDSPALRRRLPANAVGYVSHQGSDGEEPELYALCRHAASRMPFWRAEACRGVYHGVRPGGFGARGCEACTRLHTALTPDLEAMRHAKVNVFEVARLYLGKSTHEAVDPRDLLAYVMERVDAQARRE